jgi:hypothetical protein
MPIFPGALKRTRALNTSYPRVSIRASKLLYVRASIQSAARLSCSTIPTISAPSSY